MFSLPLHPQLVHFPIAFLILAAGLYIASAWKRELQIAAFIVHVAGVLACVAAILSGDADEHHAKAFPDLLEWHERLGMATAWSFGLMAVWSWLRRAKAKMWEQVLFALLYLGLLGMMAYGAHLGGEMVYEHGVGIEPVLSGPNGIR
jgi:uncharacterized membrane protein